MPSDRFPDEIRQHLSARRDALLTRWLAAQSITVDAQRTETEAPLEFHRQGMASLLTLFIDAVAAARRERLLGYLETLVVNGFLAEYAVNRLVGMFQTCQRLLVGEVRERFGPSDEAHAAVRAIRDLSDEVILACCIDYETRVARSGGRFEELFETAKLINVFLDPSGRILRVNAIAAEYFGTRSESVIGTNFTRLVDPADLPVCTKMMGFALQGDPQIFDLKVRFRPDRPIDLSTTMSPVLAEGKIAGIRLVATDVSEERELQQRLRRSEEKYRKLIENANDAIFLFRLEDGRLADTNFQARELTGFRRQELAEMHIPDLFAGTDPQRAIELIQETIAEGSSTYDALALRTKDGRDLAVEVSSNVIEYGDTRVIQSIVRDMTRRHRLEERLQERSREIEDAYRRIGDAYGEMLRVERAITVNTAVAPFVDAGERRFTRLSNQIGDIRDQVDAVRGQFGRPSADVADDENGLESRLDLIGRNLQRCEEDLAEMRRLGRRLAPDRQMPRHDEQVDLRAIVARSLDLQEFAFTGRITVRRGLADVPPVKVDGAWAGQIVYLALRASFGLIDETGRLAVKTAFRDGHVVVEMIDNGHALSQDDVRRILDPYTPPSVRDLGPVQDLKRCRLLLSGLGGALTVRPGDSRGNAIAVEFPLEAVAIAPVVDIDGSKRFDLLIVDEPES